MISPPLKSQGIKKRLSGWIQECSLESPHIEFYLKNYMVSVRNPI